MAIPKPLRPSRIRRPATAVGAALLILTSAACTVQSKNAAASGGAPSNTPPAGLTSSSTAAPGVTADTIKIGVVYPDLSSVKAFINIDLGDYEAAYNALIAELNAHGGIHGRRIVPVFGKLDVISPSAAQETCVHLTQDEKVFAVLGPSRARTNSPATPGPRRPQ
jgi:ABC-type branched-subunit amino acid transport system substrate-binding protein